jgi:hypothetical protein
MKKTITLTVALFFLLLISSCSSDDNSDSSSSLSQIEQQLVGKWNTSSNLTGNTYQYKADRTAVYINTWTNGTQTEVTTYNGAWKIINGNVLIEYYPDEDETWDNSWQQNPALKNKIEFTNSNTVKRTDYYDSNNFHFHYKEN